MKSSRAAPGVVATDVAYVVAQALAKPKSERLRDCESMREGLSHTSAGKRVLDLFGRLE
eukprot:COSAG05_NODE_462_length_9561_cov_5.923378_4_plen_59_part_00